MVHEPFEALHLPLPPVSWSIFGTLCHFQGTLINIKQGKDKPLKNYLARFNRVALEIKDLPLMVAMHFMLISLKSSDFSKFLAMRLVETMTELLTWSAKFINMEEVKVAKCQANRPSGEDKGRSDNDNEKEN